MRPQDFLNSWPVVILLVLAAIATVVAAAFPFIQRFLRRGKELKMVASFAPFTLPPTFDSVVEDMRRAGQRLTVPASLQGLRSAIGDDVSGNDAAASLKELRFRLKQFDFVRSTWRLFVSNHMDVRATQVTCSLPSLCVEYIIAREGSADQVFNRGEQDHYFNLAQIADLNPGESITILCWCSTDVPSNFSLPDFRITSAEGLGSVDILAPAGSFARNLEFGLRLISEFVLPWIGWWLLATVAIASIARFITYFRGS